MRKNRIWKWLAGLVLAAAGAAVLFAVPAVAADFTYSTITVYEWKHRDEVSHYYQNRERIMLLWKDGETTYYMGGYNYEADGCNYYGVDCTGDRMILLGEDTFLTLTNRDTPELIYVGKDGDNGDSPMYKLKMDDGSYVTHYWSSFLNAKTNFRPTFESEEPASAWTFQRPEVKNTWGTVTGYGDGTLVTHTIKGASDGHMWHYNNCAVISSAAGNGEKYIFDVYIGQPHTYSCINADLTIGKDQTFNVKDNVVIADGVTVTIEEGGMLSVEGQLYHNGKIVNRGTLVLQQNACVSPLDPQRSDSGTIQCDGGDVVMLSGSRMYFSKGRGTLQMKNRSNLVNCGDLIVGSALRMEGGLPHRQPGRRGGLPGVLVREK